MESKSEIKRRAFIGLGLLSTGSILANPFSLYKKRKGFLGSLSLQEEKIFASESGVYGKGNLFVLGFLIVKGPTEIHENNIVKIRSTHSYRSLLTYRSNDRFKIPFAKKLIQYFIDNKNLSFIVNAISGDKNKEIKNSKKRLKNKIKVYEKFHQTCKQSFSTNQIMIKDQFERSGSQGFKKSFNQKYNGARVIPVYSRQSNLLQLADLLAGYVRSELSGDVRNPVKLEVNHYIKNRLRPSHLENKKKMGGKFIIQS